MILEGIVTTTNSDGTTNVSPMGPRVDRDIRTLCLRPYQSSRTYQNLKNTGEGVFHVTDDVELLAHCAVGQPKPLPALKPAPDVDCQMLDDACRWYVFRVDRLQDDEPRTTIDCQILAQGRNRDFFGFNRAKHAVVEAAILATRLGILPIESIENQFQLLAETVDKTAGDQERRAFEFLQSVVRDFNRGVNEFQQHAK